MQQPRLANAREVAAYLRRSPSWFRAQRTRLERFGFPQRVPGTRLWDRAAIDEWLEKSSKAQSHKVEDPLSGF